MLIVDPSSPVSLSISHAPVCIYCIRAHVQGGKSVEVRPVSVTKGMSTQRMVGLMAEVYSPQGVEFDFVLCVGEFRGYGGGGGLDSVLCACS